MKDQTEMNSYSIRTDLAIEARELSQEDESQEIEGVSIETEENEEYGITVNWVKVLNEKGSKAIGKPVGNYITLESQQMKENRIEAHEEMSKILVNYLSRLHPLTENSVILVVGLGNWKVTPDALGPKVISKLLITRHIKENIPIELQGSELSNKVRSVCAVSPGVMGITGIETVEIVKGITKRVKPDLVIAIDALAARRTNRINATIQISDTGLSPGAGVGNKRAALNEKSLGVKVLAMGVPTVVDAATLVNDTMDNMLESMLKTTPKGSDFYKMLMELESEDKYRLITEILSPYCGNLFVTPKEVDAVVDRLANIIANSLNIALHPGITKDDINRFMG